MKHFLSAAIVSLALSLAACTTLPMRMDKMTPEQIKEFAKMKDANLSCVIVNTPYGQARGLYVNVDKGVMPHGGTVSVDDQCKVTMTGLDGNGK